MVSTRHDNIRAKAAARNAGRSPTPEPTTSSGVTHGNALYDTPPRGAQSGKHVSGRRVSRPSSRLNWHRADRAHSNSISAKCRVTRKYNAAKQAQEQQHSRGNIDGEGEGDGDDNNGAEGDDIDNDDGDTLAQTDVNTNNEPIRPTVHIEVPVPEPRGRTTTHAQPQPITRPRGRGRAAHNLERSPTPGSTDVEDLPIVSGNTPADSQYTYVYETVDHTTLVRIAEKRVPGGANLATWSTKDLLAAIQTSSSDQATSVAAERRPTSIQFISSTPVTVGGGQVHGEVSVAPEADSQPSGFRSGKRGSDTFNRPTAKRVCPNPDTAMEDESEDDATARQTAAATAACITSAQAHATPHPHANLQQASRLAPGTQPPPPSHQPTATTPSMATLLGTDTDTQLSRSRNGESQRLLPLLPNIFSPVRGPVHARLRALAIECAFPPELFARQEDKDELDKLDKLDKLDELDTSNPSQHDAYNKSNASKQAHHTSNRAGRVPGTPTRTERIQYSGHTYGRNRTHLASALDTLADIAVVATPPPRPNSPTLDPSGMV
ncbi:hypothetical protein FRC06_003242 [Ceratobasidium sp. 370]|nr:hypothetical protein FRC06_003242 [Ceratobasidium sp. 370]